TPTEDRWRCLSSWRGSSDARACSWSARTATPSSMPATRWCRRFGELARVQPPRRIVLRGLTRAEVARYMTMTAGVEPGDALVDGLSASRRLRLHKRVGEALERAYAGRLEHRLGELAHHFLEAAPAGDPDRGVRYAVAAAEHASDRLAYDEAARMYERALA